MRCVTKSWDYYGCVSARANSGQKMLKVAVLFAALRGSLHKVMNESQEQGKNSRHLLKSWNPIVLNEEE
jgi:hypothetical protein